MSRSYIPNNDQEFDAWLGNFLTVLHSHSQQVGLGASDLDDLDTVKDDFDAALTTYVTKRGAAQSAGAAKNTCRTTAESLLRPLVQRINHHPGMTDELRAALGLNLPGSGASTQGVGPEIPDIFL